VPSAAVADVIRECAAARVPAGIVFSAGFSESGPEGERAEAELVAAAGGAFRFVGPNSLGVAVPSSRLYPSFASVFRSPPDGVGTVALVSQSGAIASCLLSRAHEFDLAFSVWVSTGNEADLTAGDYLWSLVEDDSTAVACLVLETVRDPAGFAAACDALHARGKAVVALSIGTSDSGSRAAVSHTGALAGPHEITRAFLRRCRVHGAESLTELLVAAKALSSGVPIAGNRTAIISMSGGLCALLADRCVASGLSVPMLSGRTQERLRDVITDFGGVANPIDVTAVGLRRPEMVNDVVEIVRASGECDLVLLQMSTNADPAAAVIAARVVEAAKRDGPPLLVGRLGDPSLAPEGMALYREAGVYVHGWPEQLVDAARALVERSR
jgi:acyl-CoA synthetase (NDP forming)